MAYHISHNRATHIITNILPQSVKCSLHARVTTYGKQVCHMNANLTMYSEPLLKDTLNKGHNTFNLSIKDKFCSPYRTMAIQFYLKEGHSNQN